MKLPLRQKKSACALDPTTAEQMLQNVFQLCGCEPNSVPLSVLISYSNYRRERYALQRTIIAVILAIFMLLPLLFVAPRITVSLRAGDANPVYSVSVSSLLPVRSIQASIDGRSVPVYEADSHEYTIQPGENGTMTIEVALINRQFSSVSLSVSTVDSGAPTLVSAHIDEDCIRLYVEDAETGVDFAAVTVTDADGAAVALLGYDAETGCLMLAYPETAQTVRIPDERGNALLVQLTPEAD